MAWAHALSKAGAMASPFEFEEVMAAAMQFGTTKTVEQVVAEQEARHKEADRVSARKNLDAKFNKPGAERKPPVEAPPMIPPKQSELDKVRAMLAAGKPRVPAPEPAAQ